MRTAIILLAAIFICLPKIGLGSQLDFLPEESKTLPSRLAPESPALLPMVPAAAIYSSWDTDEVHPYSFTQEELEDTITLQLVKAGDCPFAMPVETNGKVTSRFGWRNRRMHYGIDLDLYTGDRVNSTFDGMVRLAKYAGGYGYMVVIRHNSGLETFYAHLSKLTVKPGDKVKAGDQIGRGGNTGRSSGSHLHFEIRYKGWAINPELLISFEHKELARNNIELEPAYKKVLKEVSIRKYHTVSAGETPAIIARRYKVPTTALLEWNSLSKSESIYPGQNLRVN